VNITVIQRQPSAQVSKKAVVIVRFCVFSIYKTNSTRFVEVVVLVKQLELQAAALAVYEVFRGRMHAEVLEPVLLPVALHVPSSGLQRPAQVFAVVLAEHATRLIIDGDLVPFLARRSSCKFFCTDIYG